MKKRFLKVCYFFLVFGFIVSAFGASAQVNYDDWGIEPTNDSNRVVVNSNQLVSAFRQYKDISNINIVVPTVVEVPIEDPYLERINFAVLDQTTNTFLPYYYKKNTQLKKTYYTASTVPYVKTAYNLTDKNLTTYTEFELDSNDRGRVEIKLKSTTPVTSSAISTVLASNVALPTYVEISALVNGRNKKVLAKIKMNQQTIRFPKTISKDWVIIFDYAQPLRINELRILEDIPDSTSDEYVRFLAQPNRNYRLYFDPDKSVVIRTTEAGNLYSNEGVLALSSMASRANPLYKQSDIDADGFPDIFDNCVLVYNKDQKDLDGNSRGDACEDFDKDGIMNDKDNCPNEPNRDQIDIDRDGQGDACDGEESRLTEKYRWIPWLGIVFALVVIVVLFVITAKSKGVPEPEEEQVHDDKIE